MARTIALNLLLKTVGIKSFKDTADAIDQLQERIGSGGRKAGITGGLLAATGAATQLSAALAPVAASAGALPGIMASVKAATLTAKVAFQGMGDAMGAVAEGDAKKLEEAMKDLSPAAQEVVKAAGEIMGTFEDMRKVVQDKMFKNVAGDMRNMSDNIAPVLKSGMSGVAVEMNKVGREALKFGATPMARGIVAKVFDTTRKTIAASTGSVKPFLSGMAKLAEISLPVAQRLALAAVNGAKTAGMFLTSKRGADAFKSAIETGVDRLFTFGRIIRNVASGLVSMFKQVRVDGGGVLETIEKMTAKFAAWAKTGAAQQRVAEVFKLLNDVLKQVVQLAPLLLSPLVTVAGLIAGLPAPVKSVVAGLLAMSAVFGPMAGKIFATTKAILAFELGTKGATIGTKLWAAAQWLLNQAMSNNPIAWVIKILILLGAAVVLAYNKSETFRTIVQNAWKGIVQAAQWAWNSVLKPTFEALKNFFVNVIAPAAMWLWKNVFVPAWNGIVKAVQFAWGIAKGIFNLLVGIFKNVIAPVVMWLWKNVFVPAWKAISFAIKVAWGIVKIIFGLWMMYIKRVLAPVVMWLWKNIIQPTFKSIGNHISIIWRNVVQPIFNLIKRGFSLVGSGISTVWRTVILPVFNLLKRGVGLVGDAFKKAVTLIGKVWDGLKTAARKPVDFIVNTVYAKGIKGVWDKVADFVKMPHLPAPPRFAQGGKVKGPGGTKADKVPAMLSRDEFVVNAAATRRFLPLLRAINGRGNAGKMASKMGIGDPGVPGFSLGGWLGDFFKSAKEGFLSGARKAAEKVLHPLKGLIDSTVGGSPLGRIIGGVPKKFIDAILNWIKSKEDLIGGGQVAQKAVRLARTQIGVPYVYGGNTWGKGLDCSSLVQQSWQRARGKGGFPRTTFTQRPWLTRVRTPQPGDVGQPSPGHEYMYSGNGNVVEAPRTGLRIRERKVGATSFWGRPPASWLKMDQGGMLPTGLSAIYNGTGKPEPVFTSMDHARSAVGGNTYNITVTVAPGGNLAEAGRQVVDAIKAYENRSGSGWRRP